MPNMYTLVAPCFFGTEHTLSFEVKRLGAQNVKVTDGRVAFEGDAAMIAAANLNLRTAERVLLLLKTFPAATFDELFDGVYSIPWEELIPVDAQFPVKGSSLSSQLSSVPACQSIVKKAIVKRLQYGHKTTTLPETGFCTKHRFLAEWWFCGCSTATKPPLCQKPVLCTKSALPCVKTWWK